MKTLNYSIGFLVIIFFSIQCKSIDESKNDLELIGLNGRIESFILTEYEAINKFGEISEGSRIGNEFGLKFNNEGYIIEKNDGLNISKSIYKYNSENSLKEMTSFSKDGKITNKVIYEYKNGKTSEFNSYNAYGKLIQKLIYKYVDENNMEEESFNEEGVFEFKKLSLFDENKNVIEEKNFDDNGNLEYITKYVYNKKGKVVEMTDYDSLGNINQKISYKYNSDNLEIEYIDFYNNVEDKETYKYEFDNSQNWIKKIGMKDGIPTTIIKRKIQYL